MSGFSTRRIGSGAAACAFFSLRSAACSGRQSATAATSTAASTGRAASQAACMSRALSTSTRRTPDGGYRAVGPETRATSAPSRARASAMA